MIDASLPPPKHLVEDMPPWLDLSTYRAYDLEHLTPEIVAATHYDDPKDQALMFLRTSAIRQRKHWERTHPRSEPFAGVYLG